LEARFRRLAEISLPLAAERMLGLLRRPHLAPPRRRKAQLNLREREDRACVQVASRAAAGTMTWRGKPLNPNISPICGSAAR
jgi:hypothetical protein